MRTTIMQSYALWFLATVFSTSGPALFVLLMQKGVGKFEGLAFFFFLGAAFFFALFYRESLDLLKAFLRQKKLRWWLWLSAVVDSSAFFIFIEALKGASVAEVYAVILARPIFVLLWGKILLKEKNKVRCWKMLALAFSFLFGGVLVLAVFYRIAFSTLLLASLASACMSLGGAIQVRLITFNKVHSGALTAWTMLLASMILGAIALLYHGAFILPSFEAFGLIVMLGVGTVALPKILRTKAAVLSSFTRVGFLEPLGPVIGILWGVLILGEEKLFQGSIQIALICFLSGALLAQRSLSAEHTKTSS